MQFAKDLIGKPVISIGDGRQLGIVKDIYLDRGLDIVAGIYLGSEGLLNRRVRFMGRGDVMVWGIDAVLAKHSDAVIGSGVVADRDGWVRRDRLQGQQVATADGTRMGTIDDVILDDTTRIIGFRLARVFVKGPIAARRTVAREAVIDFGAESNGMIVDLTRAAHQDPTSIQELALLPRHMRAPGRPRRARR